MESFNVRQNQAIRQGRKKKTATSNLAMSWNCVSNIFFVASVPRRARSNKAAKATA
jgi:hypothetical protein